MSGVHELVHCMSEPDVVMLHPNTEEASKSFIGENANYHEHGHGHHHHGSTLTFLLKSLDYQKLTSLLQDVRHALLWMLHMPGIIGEHNSFLGLNFPVIVKNHTTCFVGFLSSTDLDIPTPPPRLLFLN